MHIIKTISSWLSFYGVVLMFGFFLYALAKCFLGLGEWFHAKAAAERKKVNLVAK